MLGVILFATFLASIASLALVGLLLIFDKKIKAISFHLVSFAAGALLATGLNDTMPEAVAHGKSAFIYTTIFIAVFFFIERIFLHIHHHESEAGENLRLPVPLLMFGDAMHNFIDGVSIASTFLVSFPLGLITTTAVFIHEIPHELGDFGILLHMGYGRGKVLGFNVLTALTAFFGAILGFFLADKISDGLVILLSLTTANFLYLSLSDLLPEIHEKAKKENLIFHSLPFFAGMGIMLILTSFLKG